jgi:hypothetical protein
VAADAVPRRPPEPSPCQAATGRRTRWTSANSQPDGPNHALPPDLVHDRSPVSGPRLRHRGGAPAGGYLFARGKHRIPARCDVRNASRPNPEIASRAVTGLVTATAQRTAVQLR